MSAGLFSALNDFHEEDGDVSNPFLISLRTKMMGCDEVQLDGSESSLMASLCHLP